METKYYTKFDYELLDKKIVYEGKRINVEELHYRNPRTNQIIYREHVLAGRAVVIIPQTENNEFIMIKEPRTSIEKTVISFPAGKVEIGEKEEQSAIRELEEETGYKARKIKKLREFYTAKGYSNEKITIFLAKDLLKTERYLDETEDIEVIKVPIVEVKKMLDRGEITTSSEEIGLLHYFLYENKE